MGHLRDLLGVLGGAGGFPLNQQLGQGLRFMPQQEMALRGAAGLGFYVAPVGLSFPIIHLGPPSFEDWICTPNAETYQEYQERRLPKEKD